MVDPTKEELEFLEKTATWADTYSPWDMDRRDRVASSVLWEPTQEDLDNVWTIIYTKAIKETVNQNCVPSCTANALCHIVEIQNVLEEKTQDIFVDHKYQWENNQWRKWECSWPWYHLESAIKKLHANWVKGNIEDKDFLFEIDWYAYDTWNKPNLFKYIAYRLKQSRQPLYVVFAWNRQISLEIYRGERTTDLMMKEKTYNHAVCLSGVDFEQQYVYFTNSRNHNTNNIDWEKKISSFKIKFDLFEKLVKRGVFNWRFFLIFDKENMVNENLLVKGRKEAIATVASLSVLRDSTSDREVQSKCEEMAGYLRQKFDIDNV